MPLNTITPATIQAQIAGVGQGSAFGVILANNSNVPVINISRNASIIAQVSTYTVSPTKSIASGSRPFSLVTEAILDQGGSLKTIKFGGILPAYKGGCLADSLGMNVNLACKMAESSIGAATILTDPIFQGLAISLLFGLASSTLLTVLVIPAVYVVLRDANAVPA